MTAKDELLDETKETMKGTVKEGENKENQDVETVEKEEKEYQETCTFENAHLGLTEDYKLWAWGSTTNQEWNDIFTGNNNKILLAEQVEHISVHQTGFLVETCWNGFFNIHLGKKDVFYKNGAKFHSGRNNGYWRVSRPCSLQYLFENMIYAAQAIGGTILLFAIAFLAIGIPIFWLCQLDGEYIHQTGQSMSNVKFAETADEYWMASLLTPNLYAWSFPKSCVGSKKNEICTIVFTVNANNETHKSVVMAPYNNKNEKSIDVCLEADMHSITEKTTTLIVAYYLPNTQFDPHQHIRRMDFSFRSPYWFELNVKTTAWAHHYWLNENKGSYWPIQIRFAPDLRSISELHVTF